MENADGKADSHITYYDAIIAPQADITSNTPQRTPYSSLRSGTLCNQNPYHRSEPRPETLSNLRPPSSSHTQTRSGRISELAKRYDVGMNNDVPVVLCKLAVVLDIPDWSVHYQPSSSTALHLALDECDPLAS